MSSSLVKDFSFAGAYCTEELDVIQREVRLARVDVRDCPFVVLELIT